MINKKISKRIISVFLAAVLVFAQNFPVFAAENVSADGVIDEAAVGDVLTEETVSEQASGNTIVEGTVPEEPANDEQADVKPATDEPENGKPVDDAPVIDQPAEEEPETDKPATEEPASQDPVAEEPAAEETPAGESVSTDEQTKKEAVDNIVSEEAAAVPKNETKKSTDASIKESSDSRIFEAGSMLPTGAKINLKDEFGYDSDYKGLKFSITSGKGCAEINGNSLIAKKAGDVTVRATYKYDGEKGEDETSYTIYTVGFNKKSVTLNEKGEYDSSQIMKGDPSGVSPEWSSSAETVATVDQSGKVTVLTGGTTVISASYSYGDKAKVCKYKLIVKLPGLKVSEKTVNLGSIFSTKVINLEKGTAVSWYLDSTETRAEFVDQEKGKIKIKSVTQEGSPILLHCKAGSEELTCQITTTEPYLGGLPKN